MWFCCFIVRKGGITSEKLHLDLNGHPIPRISCFKDYQDQFKVITGDVIHRYGCLNIIFVHAVTIL